MKTQIKKIFSLTMLGIISTSTLHANDAPIHLHNSPPINVPSIVDGTPFGINGPQIKKLIYIIREVEKLIYGIADPTTKVRKGKYTFLGQPHSASSLAELELKSPPMSIKEAQEFKILLNFIIEDFVKIASPFIEQAHGVKAVTLGFMKEWSEKHECENSSLLDWAREKDGHEFDTFRKEVTTCENLYQFCKDLISFLSDLIQSCPRGWKQFLEMQQKNKNSL